MVGVGTIKIKWLVKGEWLDGRLENVLFVPDFKKNLFSTNECTKRGMQVIFENNKGELKIKCTGETVGQRNKISFRYMLHAL